MKKRVLFSVLLLCLLFTGCAKREAELPDSNTTVTIANRTVRFALPEGLDAEVSEELDGQVLQYRFTPMVYEFPDAVPSPSGAVWGYSGVIDVFSNAVDFCNDFDGDTITAVPSVWNHSTPVSEYGPVEGTDAPSYLFRESHDLYTPPEQQKLWDAGIYPEDTIPDGVEFWHIAFARPGEQTMVVFSLNCEVFSQDDAIALAKSVVIS